jgi:hypothetical protein
VELLQVLAEQTGNPAPVVYEGLSDMQSPRNRSQAFDSWLTKVPDAAE